MQSTFDALPAETQQTLRSLVEIFLRENAVTNLSALRTPETCFTGNVLDSLAFLLLLGKIPLKGTLIDVGTGGGFPLLPIAITRPDIRCTGLDAVKKKTVAIARMAEELRLLNCAVLAERTEVAGRDTAHRERYDVVTARAVAPLPVLLEYCSPFAKTGGTIVCWKSLHVQEELTAADAAAHALNLKRTDAVQYALPGDFGARQLLVFEKTAPTPAIYPRRIGEAKHHPITD